VPRREPHGQAFHLVPSVLGSTTEAQHRSSKLVHFRAPSKDSRRWAIVSTRVKILAAAVTLTVVAGGSAWAAEGFPGNPFGGGDCGMSPSGVVNETSGGGGDRSLDISWTPPLPTSCGKLDHYNIVVIDARGHPGQVFGTAEATATVAHVSGATLNLCTWYRLGVQAVLTSGQKSPVQFPAHAAFVSGPPEKVPPAIFVIINGTSSSGPQDEIDPSRADFCTSPDGSFPQAEEGNPHQPNPAIQHLANDWLNIGSANAATRTSGAGNNLIDSLAATGGYVLPYSYTGIDMTGDQTDPHLTVGSFTSTDVATENPMGECTDVSCEGLGEPVLLQRSLESIHSVFPDTPVVVVGHSLGGLIAEQWWLQYSATNTEGVVQVISLDAPLNGVADAGCSTGPQCATIAAISAAIGWNPVGTDAANAYTQLWQNQDSDAGSSGYANNQTALALDARNHLFTAIGEIGDPLYDALDYSLVNNVTNGVLNRGLISQVFWTEPSCAASGYDLTSSDCTATGQAVINPCGHNMDDGGRLPFGLFGGSIWIHSNVKNCSGVISDVLGWYSHAVAHPTTRPLPATVVKTYWPFWQNGFAPAPGWTAVNQGKATCDSGSADDPGSAHAVRCSPPGNGTPCFYNDQGSGDTGSPMFCSNDPTSKKVIVISPNNLADIARLFNLDDRDKPPWFLILADGRKCAFSGYGTDTKVLSYDCGGNIGATVPDRSRPRWTVHEGVFQENPTPLPGEVGVVTAYY
jgi:hypothetical protein